MVQSVRAKCIGIKDQLVKYEELLFLDALKSGFESTLGIKLENGKFSRYELEIAQKLVKEKYSNTDWLSKYE
ncbi:MAG: hypothetical protein EU532_13055 [Promethearchaeota archaeon]|nr:MAG: hypothetical protein EU532_13055 [Candidatus Lokiarchaeota archaeon]